MLVTPFGREIKHLRAERGMTVRDLAARLGKSVAYIGKIESQGEIPSADLIGELARVFGDHVHRLLELAKASLLSRYQRDLDQEYALVSSMAPRSVDAEGIDKQVGKEKPAMATVVSLINMKGGVGKTTLAAQ